MQILQGLRGPLPGNGDRAARRQVPDRSGKVHVLRGLRGRLPGNGDRARCLTAWFDNLKRERQPAFSFFLDKTVAISQFPYKISPVNQKAKICQKT
jgi:hypothetical protein